MISDNLATVQYDSKRDIYYSITINELIKDPTALCSYIATHRKSLDAELLEDLYNVIITSNNTENLFTYMRYAANNDDKQYVISNFFAYSKKSNYAELIYSKSNFGLIDFLARYYKYCDMDTLKILISQVFVRPNNSSNQIFDFYKSCKNDDIRVIMAENIIKNDMLPLLDKWNSPNNYIEESIFKLLPQYAKLGIIV